MTKFHLISVEIKQSQKYRLALFICFFISQSLVDAQGRLGVLLKEESIQCVSSFSGTLYSGIDNYVKICDSLNQVYNSLGLRTSNGTVAKDSLDLFLVVPARPGRIRLTVLNEDWDTAAVGYEYFQVKTVPGPVLMLNNYKIGPVAQLPKSLLMDCDSLSVFFTEDLPGSEAWLKITEFTLGYNYGGFHVSYLNPSNHVLFETKEIINRLGPESEISIRVKVESVGKIIKELPIYRITIY